MRRTARFWVSLASWTPSSAAFSSPPAQRQGIGRALVMHAFSLKGPLSAEVFEANASARAFYAACGFAEISRKTFDDHDPPLPLIVLMKARP